MSCTAKTKLRTDCIRFLDGGLPRVLRAYLPEKLITELVVTCGVRFRQRAYCPVVMLWAMVCQALGRAVSDRAMVQKIEAALGIELSACSGGYSAARSRFPVRAIRRAAQEVARRAPGRGAGVRGRRVLLLDGSTIRLADTPENQAKYPQPTCQRPGCGFPVLHFVALVDLGTGCIVDMVLGSLHVHDAHLARPLWDRLRPGDIVVADRGFASFGLMAALKERGVDVVVRQHQRRKIRPLLDEINDYSDDWRKPRRYPKWWRIELPKTLRVRVVTTTVRGKVLAVNTTLDPREFPAQAVLDLYQSRWHIETVFGDLKTTLGLDDVLPHRPVAARRAMWTYALAYNLVERLLDHVAHDRGIPRSRLSFKGTVDALSSGIAAAARTATSARNCLADRIAGHPNRHRPGRQEPRAVKTGQTPYPHMTRSRRLCQAALQHGRP